MNKMMLYCLNCKKRVPAEGNVGHYHCPTCGGKTTIEGAGKDVVHREASRQKASLPITLRENAIGDPAKFDTELVEAFEAMGLSETAAKIAAKGRGISEVPGDLESSNQSLTEGNLQEASKDGNSIIRAAVMQLRLEETFIESGMNEIQARAAARGRDGLGDAVMDVFRNARQILKSTENLEEASLEDHFKDMGLNETASKHAAKGHK